MKYFSLIIWFTFISSWVSAQGLSFDKTSHNFSAINETDGEVNCSFAYENKSKSNVTIIDVAIANRGAVRANWNRNPILPAEKGNITVTLNPRNLSGAYSHSIDVKTNENGVNKTYTLTVQANITPRVKTKEEIYGMMEGNLRYKTNSLRYPTMNPVSVITDTFGIYNVYGDTMTFAYHLLPAAVQILSMPAKLAPKEEGRIVFKYTAAAKNDWGNVWDKITITTNDTNRPAKSLYITGEIYDDFDAWTPEQKANAPKVSFDNMNYEFGTASEGDEISHNYSISNTGKSTLHIRKLKSSCGCTVGNPEKNDLEPGETTVIKAVFRTHGKTGKQIRTIDVITNDPTQSKVVLKITGFVNPKPKE
ncbi:MAG: DUF1573 domain-containing protein [Bacteroidales bacterium]|jgi:hypothetical protein|nr:DUF1573 domain-containing protein [Bacteroidales bacterium]